MPLDYQQATTQLRSILASQEPAKLFEAGKFLLSQVATQKPTKVDLGPQECERLVLKFVKKLLNEGKYDLAAEILWGEDLFNTKPDSVKRVWDVIPHKAKINIIGGGSLGKSYTAAAWFLLDWLRDPEMTCVKVMSVTQAHAKRNVFAHLKNLYSSAIVPLPGTKLENSIQVGEDDKQGIHLMTIPQGDSGKGRLRGFHPVPRGTSHPQFGSLSRIRLILDEAEEIPEGVWEDVDNILITLDGVEHVKVVAATNPRDRNSKFAIRCEPKDGGWPSLDMETSKEWESKIGATVIRLDGADCENVKQRKIIYPGLITWDGFNAYAAQGDNVPEYYTMARGWFPIQGLNINVIPQDLVDRAKGTFIFSGKSTFVAAIDLAFEGGDLAVMTVGRWGNVSGWQKAGGVPILFPKQKYGLQIEQQFTLAKTDTLDMAKQIMTTCKRLGITHDWVICDRTGNGTGVHDALKVQFGPNCIGLHFGSGSTHVKIMDEDTEYPDDIYDGVVTELFFSVRRFLEFDSLKFGPSLKLDRLEKELTGRRYRNAKKEKVRIESKKEYRLRNNPSPDFADSLTMLVHLVRMRTEFTAAMLATKPDVPTLPMEEGVVDKLDQISFD